MLAFLLSVGLGVALIGVGLWLFHVTDPNGYGNGWIFQVIVGIVPVGLLFTSYWQTGAIALGTFVLVLSLLIWEHRCYWRRYAAAMAKVRPLGSYDCNAAS